MDSRPSSLVTPVDGPGPTETRVRREWDWGSSLVTSASESNRGSNRHGSGPLNSPKPSSRTGSTGHTASAPNTGATS
jgi:hypothetical protein